jgi:hypothetical protein
MHMQATDAATDIVNGAVHLLRAQTGKQFDPPRDRPSRY